MLSTSLKRLLWSLTSKPICNTGIICISTLNVLLELKNMGEDERCSAIPEAVTPITGGVG